MDERDTDVGEKYGGFVDHIEHHLGTVDSVYGWDNKKERGFILLSCSSPGETVSTVTNGLRFQTVTAVMPQELVCTLKADQEQIAAMVTAWTADRAIQLGEGVTIDQLIASGSPLAEGTNIHGVLAMSHPYADDEFDILENKSGAVELQIITLIPVFPEEIDFIQRNSVDALCDRWQVLEPDLLDAHRAPAI